MKIIPNDIKYFDITESFDFAISPTDVYMLTLYSSNGGGDEGSTLTSLTANVNIQQPVPEPTTMLLFGTGVIGLVGSRLRRKKK
jgi:PEP-CTERM motif